MEKSPVTAIVREQQLVSVADRLCREFAPAGGPAAEALRQQVYAARARFGTCKVTTYLPVLIEREVRRDIGTRPPAATAVDPDRSLTTTLSLS